MKGTKRLHLKQAYSSRRDAGTRKQAQSRVPFPQWLWRMTCEAIGCGQQMVLRLQAHRPERARVRVRAWN